MSLETQIKQLLESDESVTEDELIEETIEDISDESSELDEDKNEPKDESEEESEDEDEDEDEDESEDKDDKKKTVNITVKEHVDALFNGEELSEEFRTKATTIFEAAVADGVKKSVEALEEQYNVMLNEAIEAVQDELIEKIDGYLSALAEEWLEENRLAVERGVKADLVEDFIDGLKTLFNEHYIDIPESKADVLDEQATKLEETMAKLTETTERLNKLEQEYEQLEKIRQIEIVGEELSDSQFEKFASLCEDVSYESEDAFVSKIKIIKENYFPTKTVKDESKVNLDTPIPPAEVNTGAIDMYVKALSNPLTFKK